MKEHESDYWKELKHRHEYANAHELMENRGTKEDHAHFNKLEKKRQRHNQELSVTRAKPKKNWNDWIGAEDK